MAEIADLEAKRQARRDRERERWREKHGSHLATGQYRQICWVCGDEFHTRDRNIKVCGDGGCAKATRRQRVKPFTVAHFKKWAAGVILDTGDPWKVEPFQAAFLEDLFAGIPECWLLIGEGNTKTTLLGGVGLYHCQFQRGGRVPIAAASRDQAMEMFLQMESMITNSEMLQPLFMAQEGNRRIKCPSMASRIQIFSADDRTGDGVIFTLALLDELHRQRDMRLYRTWSGKRLKRGGQIGGISTAGEPGSEFEETRLRIKKTATIRENPKPGYTRSVAGAVVLHEYAVPDNANIEDMRVAKLANPFSGITIKSLKEKRTSPTMTLPHWARFTCNRATRGFVTAITEAEWFRQKTEIQIPAGVPVWAGLDVAWKWDTTALVPYWMRDNEFAILGEASILEPPRNGDMLDPDEIEDALLQQHERNPIHTLVMDMSRAETIAAWAQEHLGCEVVDRAQSPALACLDYERFMEWLGQRWLWHIGDPGLTSHAMNASVKMYPDGKSRFIRPARSRNANQDVRVIDAITAASMVHSTAVADMAVEDGEIMVAFT